MMLDLQSHEDVMRAAQVSRRWRNAALGCEQFFIALSLELDISTPTIVSTDDIDICAGRIETSAPTPIQLHIGTKTASSVTPALQEILHQIRELLIYGLPRIVDLSVQAAGTIVGVALSVLVDHPAFRLRRLELIPLEDQVPEFQLLEDILLGGTPRLYTLCLFSSSPPTGPVATLATVRRVELYWTETCISDVICGDFPHLQYLHLEEITPVVTTTTHGGRSAIPSLQTLVVFCDLDDQLSEIDFSGLNTLTVVGDGVEDAAVFLAHGPTVERLELRVPYGEPHSLVDENMSDAVAHLAIVSSSISPSTAATRRTVTFGLTQHLEIPALGDLSPIHSIAQDLALVDMAHFQICEFLSLEAEFPNLETVRSNFHAECRQDFFPVDADAGLCPALQLLNIYSTTSGTDSTSWFIHGDTLVMMCTQMGFFERETADRPRLLIQGLELDYDEDGDDEGILMIGLFSNVTIEVRTFAFSELGQDLSVTHSRDEQARRRTKQKPVQIFTCTPEGFISTIQSPSKYFCRLYGQLGVRAGGQGSGDKSSGLTFDVISYAFCVQLNGVLRYEDVPFVRLTRTAPVCELRFVAVM